jgi:hypothetical protein
MADPTGKLIIMRKHFQRENGKRARRKFYEPGDIDFARELARRFANGNDEDFIVAQVVFEASRPSKKVVGGGRSLGIPPE